MDAYKVIVTKRDTRAYAPTPIPEETLRRILQAGRMAGSAKNLQPCRFVVVREQARKAELASCGQFAAYIPTAAALIAVVIPEDGRDFDAGRAAQNMMLAAWNEGIASCPVTMHDQACALRVLGVPAGHRVAIVLALGYPAPEAERRPSSPRLPFEEYVHWERW
ncbi:MAG TPA: nitroreductase family protein [Dehalococcoidia bacterium]|nr:nitroreductase family protein [Dehalococcoidia bacterium]